MPVSTAQTTRSTLHLAVLGDLDLGDLRDVAAEGELHGDAAAAAGRQRRAPAGLLGGEIEHGLGARRLAEQRAAELDRILLGGRGELVDEALDHEDIVGGADAAPEAGAEARGLVRTYSTSMLGMS